MKIFNGNSSLNYTNELLFNSRIRSQILVIGAQRSGKTFFSDNVVKNYISTGRNALIYNLGRPDDFSMCQAVNLQLPTLEAQAEILRLDKKKKKLFFEKGIFSLMAINLKKESSSGSFFTVDNFNKLKGAFKAYRIPDYFSEELFFKAYFKYISNTILVLDDPLSIYRSGIKANIKNLHFRMNHSGTHHKIKSFKGKGTDIINQFHSIEQVPSELFDYCTHIVNFRYEFKPKFETLSNPYLQEELSKCFDFLQSSGAYSYTITNIKNRETLYFKNN